MICVRQGDVELGVPPVPCVRLIHGSLHGPVRHAVKHVSSRPADEIPHVGISRERYGTVPYRTV